MWFQVKTIELNEGFLLPMTKRKLIRHLKAQNIGIIYFTG